MISIGLVLTYMYHMLRDIISVSITFIRVICSSYIAFVRDVIAVLKTNGYTPEHAVATTPQCDTATTAPSDYGWVIREFISTILGIVCVLTLLLSMLFIHIILSAIFHKVSHRIHMSRIEELPVMTVSDLDAIIHTANRDLYAETLRKVQRKVAVVTCDPNAGANSVDRYIKEMQDILDGVQVERKRIYHNTGDSEWICTARTALTVPIECPICRDEGRCDVVVMERCLHATCYDCHTMACKAQYRLYNEVSPCHMCKTRSKPHRVAIPVASVECAAVE